MSSSQKYKLEQSGPALSLIAPEGRGFKPFILDFLEADRLFRNNEGDLLLRSLGDVLPHETVIDATGGFCFDSFRIAKKGYNIVSFEENEVVYKVVADAAQRLIASSATARFERWRIINGRAQDAFGALHISPSQCVFYLDPMFPDKKSAASKELQILQDLCDGSQNNIDALIEWAFTAQPKKVVIKRPKKAAPLHPRPSHQLAGKTIRWDVYLPSKKKES